MNELNREDPIRRNAEKDVTDLELSPMDPPDAYKPPATIDVDLAQLHPFLKELMEDHRVIKEALENFEKTIISMKQSGVSKEMNGELSEFFRVFNEVFIPHDKKEEKKLFPVLEEALLKKGEHSNGPTPTTSVDVMEDDHLRAIQLASVIFNFFALASRLRDEVSRNLVLDAAISQSDELIELLRLHIFREDSIVFPLAHKYINQEDLDAMQPKRCSHV